MDAYYLMIAALDDECCLLIC